MGFVYLDSTPVDDGSPYRVGWDSVEWGAAPNREPTVSETTGGKFVVYPMAKAVGERKGKFALYAYSLDIHEKFAIESTMQALLSGSRQIHRGGRYLNVYFVEASQTSDDARKAPRIAGVEGNWIAYDPFWYLNQPLKGLVTPTNIGDEWALYDDNSLPVIIPDFEFAVNTFALNNWGTAFTFGAGTITDGPVSTTVYLKSGSNPERVAVTLDSNGDGSFAATSELFLDVGDNTIRVEDSAGVLQTVGGSFLINFGETYMRFR